MSQRPFDVNISFGKITNHLDSETRQMLVSSDVEARKV